MDTVNQEDPEARDLPRLRGSIAQARAEDVFERQRAGRQVRGPYTGPPVEIVDVLATRVRAVEVGREAIFAADVADPRSTAEIVVDALIAEGLLPRVEPES